MDQQLGVAKPKPQPINTGLKILCPRCLETLELIHQDKGRHLLRRVKQHPYAQALIRTRQTLTMKQFNLSSWISIMQNYGVQNRTAVEKLFWQQVSSGHIFSCGRGFFRYKTGSSIIKKGFKSYMNHTKLLKKLQQKRQRRRKHCITRKQC